MVFPPAPATPPARGCWKTGLIGCGSVSLVVLLGLIAAILYIRRNPERMTDFMMRQVESSYAPDVTEAEKRELRAAYADFRRAVVEKRVTRDSLQDMRSTLLSGGPGSSVTREQVRSLTETFRAATERPASRALTPGAALSATPTP